MSSPYIHAYHGLTFVIHVPGLLLHEELFASVLSDVALMRVIGIKPVLVLGPSYQIDRRLADLGISSEVVGGMRITDDKVLQVVKECAGSMRFEVEAVLARGLTNMPTSTRVSVVSGSFYSAQPVGIIDGTDYGYSGKVRRIDAAGINRRLDEGDIIVISNVGFSPSGQLFNCQSEQVAMECSVQLEAAKLIYLYENDAIFDTRNGQPITNMSYEMATKFLENHNNNHDRINVLPQEFKQLIQYSIRALKNGVVRSHILNRFTDGVLLMEVFHRDGVGLMISKDMYEGIRPAQLKDVLGMMEIIRPLMELGILKLRKRTAIEDNIASYTVIERDGMIIACLSLEIIPSIDGEDKWAELGCFVVHKDYRKLGKGDAILSFAEMYAASLGVKHLIILSTQSFHWFQEKGFEEIQLDHLPKARREQYDALRKPKIFRKILVTTNNAGIKQRYDDALRVQLNDNSSMAHLNGVSEDT